MTKDLNDAVLKFGDFIKLLDSDEITPFLTNIQRHHGEFMPLFISKTYTFKKWFVESFIWLKSAEGHGFWNTKFEQYAELYQITL